MPTTVVTLLVTPEDAEKISLASSVGRITLTLRNPLDVEPTQTTGTRVADADGRAGAAAGRRRCVQAQAASLRPAPAPRPPPPIYRWKRFVRRSARRRWCEMGSMLLAAVSGGTVAGQQIFGATAANQAADQPERVLLTAGRSTVLITEFDIARIAVTNPAVADAVVVKPREILVDGKGSGTVSLIVWGATERKHYDLVVDPGVTSCSRTSSSFPG